MSQSLINDLVDQVSALSGELETLRFNTRLQSNRLTEQRMRAQQAEAALESLKQLDDVRRKALAGTVIAYGEANHVIIVLEQALKSVMPDTLVDQIIKDARAGFSIVRR